MQVILLERVAKLGQMGDVVNVKPGFARNFLMPRGKAVRATEAAKKDFDARRAGLEARNAEARAVAQEKAGTLDGQSFVMIRSAGESGVLYGSVSARDVADAIVAGGFEAGRDQVVIRTPIKTLGLHQVPVTLHPEVQATVTINVARSADEAERQARGESVAAERDELDLEALGLEVGAALNEAGPRAEM